MIQNHPMTKTEKKEPKEKKKNHGYRFRPSDVERWEAAAKKENRSLTNWMEWHLNNASK